MTDTVMLRRGNIIRHIDHIMNNAKPFPFAPAHIDATTIIAHWKDRTNQRTTKLSTPHTRNE